MTKVELIREVVKLLELSSMDAEERTMWTVLAPNMEEAELIKLKTTLEKEVNKMTDLYLKTVSRIAQDKNSSKQ